MSHDNKNFIIYDTADGKASVSLYARDGNVWMNKNIDFGGVADLYDIYVQWDVDIPFFQETAAGASGEVLELMSGTGRLSIPLLQQGTLLCCVDYSAEMLNVLRRKLRMHNLTADVHEKDVRTLALGRSFELILLPFHSLSEIIEPGDRASTLSRIRMHLVPGGRFVVTLHNPAIQVPRLDGTRRLLCDRLMPNGDATLRVWSTGRYPVEGSLGEAVQEYEIMDKYGHMCERHELSLRFAVIDRQTFEAEATKAGFNVLHLWGDYSRGRFEPEKSPFMIWELANAQ
jgi:SAM-dependent methyltransferase